MQHVEYMVNDCMAVEDYIYDEIGIECETTLDDLDGKLGSVIVFEIYPEEHDRVRRFITDNGYWSQ